MKPADRHDGGEVDKAPLLARRKIIRDVGTKVIPLPPRSPNLNAYAERFVRSIEEECLDRMIFVGHGSLRRAVREYIEPYHRERNHQCFDNRRSSRPAGWNADFLLPQGGMIASL